MATNTKSQSAEKLTDKSLMPYGKKYKNDRLIDIPDSYLVWIYENDYYRVPQNLRDYIEENLSDKIIIRKKP